tara:strand:+ start:275 stop:748 length:474 start_codon:yes stop_codon:yes gene_type:complete
MIYFWSKYNNITMDFSDFSEFIGPIIFGLIAWLSNYFGKKKKPPKDGEQNNINQIENDKTFQSIFDDFNKEKEAFSKQEENVISDEAFAEREIIQEEVKEQTIEPKEVEKEPKILTNTETDNKPISKIKKKSIRGKLKNKSGLKEAIIMKEILDKKY